MTRRVKQVFLAMTLVLISAAAASAHEQKFMGTVAALDGVHLTITTTEGKSVMVMLHDKTKIFRGKEAKKPADIRKDDRIVVTTTDGRDKEGKSMLMANDIRLGTTPPKK